MPRFLRSHLHEGIPVPANTGLDELYLIERSIDRRLSILLVLFAFIIIGALTSGSNEIPSIIFAVGSILVWLLAISVILTARKAGAVAHTLKYESLPYSRIEGKLYSKLIRWILGYIIPIFCAIVLTFGSVASNAGWLINAGFYNETNKLKSNIPEIKIQSPDQSQHKTDTNFEPINKLLTDSVNGNRVPATQSQARGMKAKVPNKHFRSIDSLAN